MKALVPASLNGGGGSVAILETLSTCYRIELNRSLLVKGCERKSAQIIRKNWVLVSRLSRSLQVIGTDTNRPGTYEFLLVVHW